MPKPKKNTTGDLGHPQTPRRRPTDPFPTPPETPGRRHREAGPAAERLLKLVMRSLAPDSASSEANGVSAASMPLMPSLPVDTRVTKSSANARQIQHNGSQAAVKLSKRTLKDHKRNEVISISSDDDAANPKLAPGDTPFRGRNVQSRVATVQSERSGSPLRTRGFYRRLQTQTGDEDEDVQDASTMSRSRRRPIRSAETIVSSDEGGDEVDHSITLKREKPDTSQDPSPSTKRSREPKQKQGLSKTPVLIESDDKQLPTVLEFLDSLKKKPTSPRFIDDKAASSNGGQSNAMSEDDYDREDSFIDDGPLSDNETPDDYIHRNRAESPIRADMDRQPTSGAAHNEDEDDNDLDNPSDEETQYEFAKIQSIITKLRKHLSEDDYQDTMRLAARSMKKTAQLAAQNAAKKTLKKGKAKAAAVVPVEETEDELEGLSDREKDQLLLAMSNSLKDSGRRSLFGESSGSSSASVADMASAVFSSGHSSTAVVPTGVALPTTPTAIQGPTIHPITPVTPSNNGNGTITSAPVTPAPGITFTALMAQTPGASAHAETSTSNYVFVQHCSQLPATNDVHKRELFDPILGPDYANLCNLSPGMIVSWSKARGRGNPWFCQWGLLCPNMSATLVLQVIRFKESAKYINPSRISPTVVHLRESIHRPPRYQLMRNRSVVYGISCGKVIKCSLLAPGTHGMQQKYIHVSLHKQEWERFVAWICMVFGQESMDGQLSLDGMQFSTRSVMSKEDPKPGETRTLMTDAFVIDTDDDVPVYDARSAPPSFNFEAQVDNIDTALPRWTEGEIPTGSCVAVAYSVVSYFSAKKRWTLGCNIRWAMVLGVKDPAVEDV